MAQKNELEIINLNKFYQKVHILKDINIATEKGDFLVLVGPSGCGKSTLLSCIAGFEALSSGSISLNGKDLENTEPGDRDIAMVFQSYALYPTMTVAKNITFSLDVHKIAPAIKEKKLKEVAKKLKLEELLNRKPGQLSGGQRQRVAMGRALVREPTLFLFDEPLSNLDAKLRVTMRTEIKQLHQSLETTMVYVTHDQIEAMTLATKIVVLNQGGIQQIGSPYEIYNTPANQFVADFMGSPSMNLLEVQVSPHPKGMEVVLTDDDNKKVSLIDSTPIEGLKDRQKITLGIRPEHICIQKEGLSQTNVLQCYIDVVEPAGADTYLITSLNNKEVTIRVNADTKVKNQQKRPLYFDLSKANYFDSQTQNRIARETN